MTTSFDLQAFVIAAATVAAAYVAFGISVFGAALFLFLIGLHFSRAPWPAARTSQSMKQPRIDAG